MPFAYSIYRTQSSVAIYVQAVRRSGSHLARLTHRGNARSICVRDSFVRPVGGVTYRSAALSGCQRKRSGPRALPSRDACERTSRVGEYASFCRKAPSDRARVARSQKEKEKKKKKKRKKISLAQDVRLFCLCRSLCLAILCVT